MCYEFLHPCEITLNNSLASFLPTGSYLLIRIGEMNYLYCKDRPMLSTAKAVFQKEGIRLFKLPVEEMISVIDYPGMEREQRLFGTRSLLEGLRKRAGKKTASLAA